MIPDATLDAMVPKLSVTAEWWAEKIVPLLKALKMEEVEEVSVKKAMASGLEAGKLAGQSVKKKARSIGGYVLRQGKGCWDLVFNGVKTVIRDCRGIALVAQLLFHPPLEGIHATELAALAFGQSVVQEASLAGDGEAGKKSIEKEARECMAVIHDPSASEVEKNEAKEELESLAKSLKVVSHAPASGAEKQVRAVRRAIGRFISGLRKTRDPSKEAQRALRAFGEHLHQFLWIPSSRYSGSRRTRVGSGTAGRFVYERPKGVRWSE